MYNISSLKKIFWKSRVVSRAKQRQRNVQKKYAARAKLFFCQLDHLRRLALHDLYFV